MLIDNKTAAEAEQDLFARVADPAFPCVGAKSAMARGTLKVLSCHSLDSGWDDLVIHRALMDWADEYRAEPGGLRSLAVVFNGALWLVRNALRSFDVATNSIVCR